MMCMVSSCSDTCEKAGCHVHNVDMHIVEIVWAGFDVYYTTT